MHHQSFFNFVNSNLCSSKILCKPWDKFESCICPCGWTHIILKVPCELENPTILGINTAICIITVDVTISVDSSMMIE